jgi:hypothetical protein
MGGAFEDAISNYTIISLQTSLEKAVTEFV